jgi:hypothetical protein
MCNGNQSSVRVMRGGCSPARGGTDPGVRRYTCAGVAKSLLGAGAVGSRSGGLNVVASTTPVRPGIDSWISG